MSARTPEEVPRLWAETFSAGDLDALVALYEEEDAMLVPQPGEAVTGIDGIREALSAFLAMRPTFNLEVRKVLQTGDLALSFADWTLSGTGPDGEAIEGQFANVVSVTFSAFDHFEPMASTTDGVLR